MYRNGYCYSLFVAVWIIVFAFNVLPLSSMAPHSFIITLIFTFLGPNLGPSLILSTRCNTGCTGQVHTGCVISQCEHFPFSCSPCFVNNDNVLVLLTHKCKVTVLLSTSQETWDFLSEKYWKHSLRNAIKPVWVYCMQVCSGRDIPSTAGGRGAACSIMQLRNRKDLEMETIVFPRSS